jgi:flagellar biosynthesis/type III secretory pathway M-ring protein FliF/YscJ
MPAFAHLSARWNALPRAMRLAVGATALLLAAVSIAAGIATHPPRTPLFAAALHPEQIAEVEERLAQWNVPFTPTADNIVVDARRRNDLLLRLSLAGVPHAHLQSAAEALANVGVLAPQAVIDAQTRAGLAGEIEAGLRGIAGVDDASVIVAPATQSEFADGMASSASASVRLRLRGSEALSPLTVAGVRAFVAASVPKLEARRVTILDDRGVALRDTGPASDDAAQRQQSLQSALDTAFGAGAAIVRVRAEYDSRHTSEREVRRSPTGVQPIERTRRSESYDGAGRHYRQLDEGEDRGSDTHEVVSQAEPGGLLRLSAAVFVDRSRALDLVKVRDFAAATVGYDAGRGDGLVVEEIDFHQALVPRKDLWWLLYGTLVPLAPALIVTLGLFACARTALPPLTALAYTAFERAATERASKTAVDFPPARVRSMLEREPPHAAAAIISALPAATATAVLQLYPPHEREAIVARMQRRHAPLLNDAEELLRRHV